MVMECGKGQASRTMQRFDRNVPLSRRRLSNNYERDEELERIGYPWQAGIRTRYEHAQVLVVVRKLRKELQHTVGQMGSSSGWKKRRAQASALVSPVVS